MIASNTVSEGWVNDHGRERLMIASNTVGEGWVN